MDLEDLGFIPPQSDIIFHYWYLKFCIPLVLAQIVQSTERDVDEKGIIEGLKDHCGTDTA